MSLVRRPLAGPAAVLIAAAALAVAGGPPARGAAASSPATEHDLCRTDAARPAPGPPTWWPSRGRCLPIADDDEPGGVGLDLLDARILLGLVVAGAAAAAAGATSRVRRAERRPET
jgi:hypothetical protein